MKHGDFNVNIANSVRAFTPQSIYYICQGYDATGQTGSSYNCTLKITGFCVLAAGFAIVRGRHIDVGYIG